LFFSRRKVVLVQARIAGKQMFSVQVVMIIAGCMRPSVGSGFQYGGGFWGRLSIRRRIPS
jgi:hypothetical protein